MINLAEWSLRREIEENKLMLSISIWRNTIGVRLRDAWNFLSSLVVRMFVLASRYTVLICQEKLFKIYWEMFCSSRGRGSWLDRSGRIHLCTQVRREMTSRTVFFFALEVLAFPLESNLKTPQSKPTTIAKLRFGNVFDNFQVTDDWIIFYNILDSEDGFIFHLVWWLFVFYSVRHCCCICVIPLYLKRKVVMRQFMAEHMSSKRWPCPSVLLVLLVFFSLAREETCQSKAVLKL